MLKGSKLIKVMLSLILVLTPIIAGTAFASTKNVPQPVLNQLQSQMIDFEKKASDLRHHKIIDLDIRLVSQEMQDNTTAVAIFDVDKQFLLDYQKVEDAPILKGVLKFKEKNQDTLSPSAKAKVEKYVNLWKQDLDSYIKNPNQGSARMKVVGKIINGALDSSTVEFFLEGVTANDFSPYSLTNVPSSDEVEQKGYKSMEKATKTSSPTMLTSYYNRLYARDYITMYTSNTSTLCRPGSSAYQDKSYYNPNYPQYTCTDCANYVSQALHYGGIPMDDNWQATSSWATTTWINTGYLFPYFMSQGYIYECDLAACVAGYPFKIPSASHSLMIDYNDGSTQYFSAHTSDRKHVLWSESQYGTAVYYEVVY